MSLWSIGQWPKVAQSIVWWPNIPRSNDSGQMSCFVIQYSAYTPCLGKKESGVFQA